MTEEFECQLVEAVKSSYGLRLVKLERLGGSVELKGFGDLMGFGNWPVIYPDSAGAFAPGKRYRLTVEELP